jgi:hypothetical protein
MTGQRVLTRTAEVQPWGVGNAFSALLDAKVVGPMPMIIRFTGRENLLATLGEDTQLTIADGVKDGDMVVVRRDQF